MQLTASDLNRLMQDGETIVVRNRQNGITVFTDDNTKAVTTWEAYGDRWGGDIREVPPTILGSPIFREHLLRGIFSIESAPEVLDNAIAGMRQKWADQTFKAQNAQAQIEASKEEVVASAQTCIAPKGRGEICGNYAIVMGKDSADRPPLCAEHKDLIGDYVSQPTGREIDGKPEVIWKRKQLTTA